MKNKKDEWGILSLIFSLTGMLIFISLIIGSKNISTLGQWTFISFIIVFSILGLISGIIQKKYNQTTFGKIGFILGIVFLIISILMVISFFILAPTMVGEFMENIKPK